MTAWLGTDGGGTVVGTVLDVVVDVLVVGGTVVVVVGAGVVVVVSGASAEVGATVVVGLAVEEDL